MRRRSRLWPYVGVGVVAVLVAGLLVVQALMVPSIVIVNGAGSPLTQLRCTFSCSGRHWTEAVDHLASGETMRASRRVSDLHINSMECRLRGSVCKWDNGGIATTGENLRVAIGDDGKVSMSYSR